MSNEQNNSNDPWRIQIKNGSRANSPIRNAWYNGNRWDGKSGDWYYRFDGIARVEAVFGCHHVIVFLDGRTTCLVNGVEVNISYPASLVPDNGSDIGTVLVPLSLLIKHLNIPITNKIAIKSKESVVSDKELNLTKVESLIADKSLQDEWHPRLVAKISALIAGNKNVYLSKKSKLLVTAVDLASLSAQFQEQMLHLPWAGVTALDKAEMLLREVDSRDAEAFLIAAVYLAAAGKQSAASQCLEKAAVHDRKGADALRDKLMRNQAPSDGGNN